MFLTRRRFLKTVAVSASAVTLTQLTGCFSDDNDDHGPSDALVERRKALFPQSVMSGDPRPTSIILWTRVGGFGQDVAVTLQVSRNRDFNQIIVDQALTAQAVHDHCLKVRVTALEPDRHYYYRFICDGVASNIARTRTAADPTADRKVKFAFASCQDYNGRYYNVYLRLLEADMDDLDFVVHLGDYIYETDRDPDFQTGSADRQVVFEDREGAIALRSSQGATFYAARSLSNYRQLYRTYRGDSVLQQVHEKFPLVAIWDDHEFSDDSWQNNGTYTDGAQGEGDLERKRNAEQVYFEFMPIDQDNVGEALVSAAGAIGIDPARLSQGSVDESTGVGSLSEGVSIYRALRFGKHVELFLTDFRTHRADHLIPEDAFPGQVVVSQTTLQAVTPPGSPVSAFTVLQAGGAFAADGSDLFTYLDLAAPQAGLEALFAAVLTGNGSANPAANPLLGAAFQGYLTALTDAGLEAAAAQGRALMLAQQGLAGGVLVRVINSLLTGIRATPTGPAIIDQLNAALTGNGSPVTLVTDASGAVSLPVELTAGLRKGIGYATMGKSGLCSDLGSRYLVVKPIYDLYAAISHATGTRSQDMYGATQLNWLGEGLNQSSATWRVLGTSVSFTPMVLGLKAVLPDSVKASLPAELNNDFYLNVDQWDGYPVYRDGALMPLMTPTERSPNGVISIAGDIHSTWVSDHGEGRFCFTTASISSETFYGLLAGQVGSLAETLSGGDPARKERLQSQANGLLALADIIIEQSDAKTLLGRTQEHGIGIVEADAQGLLVRFVQVKPTVAGLNMIGQSWYHMPSVVRDAMFERRYRVESNTLTLLA